MASPSLILPAWPHAPTADVSSIGEHGIIRWIREAAALLPARDVVTGIGDDAAIITPLRNHLEVLTTDMQVEDVHFAWSLSTPALIGARALHVNLSDVAAMGAVPRHVLLSLGLPGALPGERLHALLEGLLQAAHAAGVALIGGNISQAPVLTIDLTLSGAVKRRHVLRRTGAHAGDEVYMSGAAGAAAAGLAWLLRHADSSDTPDDRIADAIQRYRSPVARVSLGLQVARNRAASSCMDTSDGLTDALQQMAEASGVGMRIERTLVPMHPAVAIVADQLGLDRMALALGGGEDYELVFTVPRRRRRAFLHATGRTGLPPVTRIGVCTRDTGIVVVDDTGTAEPLPAGYEHFVTVPATGA